MNSSIDRSSETGGHPKMRILSTIAIGAVLTLSANVVEAGKPKGAKNMDPKAVIMLYAGHTSLWSKGLSYWAADGQQRAIWEAKEKQNYGKHSIGIGKWTVNSKGKQCFQTTWHWQPKGGEVDTLKGDKRCREHVVTEDGQVWVREMQGDDRQWWHFKPKEKFKKGDKTKSIFKKTANRLGVSY